MDASMSLTLRSTRPSLLTRLSVSYFATIVLRGFVWKATCQINYIQLINIPFRHGTYLVEISNGEVTKSSQKKRADGNYIIWSESLSFTGDLADQTSWCFRIVKTRLGVTKTTVGSHEEKLLDLLQSQKDYGSCKFTVSKDCQLMFTIERLRDALPALVNDVENAIAGTSTLERPVDAANLVMKAHDILVDQEDPWMSFLPHFETFMSIVDTITEVHPYVQLAWSILSVIPKTIISQNERDNSINTLSQRLKEVYEYITDAKRLPALKETQRKALSVLVQQTIECAYFLKEYAASNKASAMMKGVTIDKKINDFNEKFDHILNVITNSLSLETSIVTLRISNDIIELRENVDESKNLILLGEMPRAPNAGFLSTKACLPGTRQGLITEILDWVNAIGDGSQRLFLLLGQAGTGKSAVAHTVSQIFKKQNRLGSLFCFSQSDKESRGLLFSTISRELADGDVQWRKRLVQIIKETSVRTSLDILTQFDELIIKPSEVVNTIGPVVIIIDGLDESGNRAERKDFLDLLFKRCTELPSNYRFVITSRPEPDIERMCKHPAVFCKRMTDIDPAETTDDIKKYIVSRLSSVESILDGELDVDWRALLAKQAEGVFQWANLACDIINPTVEFGLSERVKTFIFGSTSTLYQMYHQIFLSRPEFEHEGYLPAFKTIMGALIIMRKPLSIQALQFLFQKSDFRYNIKSMMAPFHSLFLGTNDLCTPVRPLHTSLTDFLTARSIEVIKDAKKIMIPNLFYVDTSNQGYFTLACLKLMNGGDESGLRFNICNLESSYRLNEDVPDLDDRIQREIPSHLSYASYFWAVHLQQSTVSEDLLVQLRHLMRTNLLYLFETLSLLDKSVEQVCISMKLLMNWCEGVDSELAIQAEDACQFGYDYGDVMVESTPHLYISALPFAPKSSFIRDQYLNLFPRHLNIEDGQSLESRRGSVIKRHPHFSTPTVIAFSPQGKYIATGFTNGDLWLWDYKTGAMVNQCGNDDEKKSGICMIVFSPTGELITSCFLDGSFKTLNIHKNELVSHSYGIFEGRCAYSTISNDGCHIVLHSDLNEISLYNIASHSTIRLGFSGGESLFSPNGEFLAIMVGTKIHRTVNCEAISLWNIQNQELIGSIPGAEAFAMAFSPDSNHIAVGCEDGIQIWEVLTVTKVREFAGVGLPRKLIFSRNSQNLIFSIYVSIQIIDISTGTLVQSIPIMQVINSLAISPDDKHVAWSTAIAVQVQECGSTSRRTNSIDDGLRYMNVTLSPLNAYIILEGFDHDHRQTYLQILDTATIPEITMQAQLKNFTTEIGISPNDKYIAYAATHGLCIWSSEGGERVLDTSDRKLTALAFSFTSDCLIAGDQIGVVMLWNTHTYQLVNPSYEVTPLETPIIALAFSSASTQFLVAYQSGSNHRIEIHSSASGKLLEGPFTPPTPKWPHGRCFVTFSANETHIVYVFPWSGSILDARTGQILKTFGNEIQALPKLRLSPNRKYIAQIQNTHVTVWDINAGEEVDGKWVDCKALMAVFSDSAEQVVVLDANRNFNFWDISTGNKSATIMSIFYNMEYEDTTAPIVLNEKYILSVHEESVVIWRVDKLEKPRRVSCVNGYEHQSNDQEFCTPSVIDHSDTESFDGTIHDQIASKLDEQERTDYILSSESYRVAAGGWIMGRERERLFWVPAERHIGLRRPRMVHLMGAPITKLNFDNFVHGSRWTACKESI